MHAHPLVARSFHELLSHAHGSAGSCVHVGMSTSVKSTLMSVLAHWCLFDDIAEFCDVKQ